MATLAASATATIPGVVFTSLGVATTASIGGTYIPPFAGTNTRDAGAATTSTSSHNPNPTTPAFLRDFDWIESYLAIHVTSDASYRYVYIMWILIAIAIAVTAAMHLTGNRGGALGARWAKWAMRRRTWRKKKARPSKKPGGRPGAPFVFPSNAQVVSMVLLFAVPLLLCVLGPDYIAPGTKVFDLAHNMTRRSLLEDFNDLSANIDTFFKRDVPVASTATTRPPDFTIQKTWWTMGNRTGIMAYALFPLVVIFALKAPPFAILAIPFTVQIHFDKLARLHRWTGRLIWFVTTVHVLTWLVQLKSDHRHGHRGVALDYAFLHLKFIYGFMGYIFLTLLTVLSIGPVRAKYYEAFYIGHIILVPLSLIFSGLHHPPIWGWCLAPLALWIAERTWRMFGFLYRNGLIFQNAGGERRRQMAENIKNEAMTGMSLLAKRGASHKSTESWEMDQRRSGRSFEKERPVSSYSDPYADRPALAYSEDYQGGQAKPRQQRDHPPSSYNRVSAVEGTQQQSLAQAQGAPMRHTRSLHFPSMHPLPSIMAAPTTTRLPPPGYARAVALPGQTIRLSIITSRRFTWAPGQHILVSIPEIAKFQSHPFTVASISDSAIAGPHGRELILVIRVKNGFTRRLWNSILGRSYKSGHSAESTMATMQYGDEEDGDLPPLPSMRSVGGAVYRTYVDGPFGSSVRAHWGSHSTAVIICGGSGISFGSAILEYLCLCLNGRDGRSLGGKSGGVGKDSFLTRRVRFVWISREFSHLHWCAPVLRRCIDMIPDPNVLQMEIFVTHMPEPKVQAPATPTDTKFHAEEEAFNPYMDPLMPPTAPFAKQGKRGRAESFSSVDSADSHMTDASQFDISTPGEEPDIVDTIDLTNFDGDDDTAVPGEAQFSLKLRKTGKMRRSKSRHIASAAKAKAELNKKLPHMPNPHEERARTPKAAQSWDGAGYPPAPRLVPPKDRDGRVSPSPMKRYTLQDASQYGSVSEMYESGPGSPYSGAVPSLGDGADSMRHLMASRNQSAAEFGMPPTSGGGAKLREDTMWDVDDEEYDDLEVVSEKARPGKPKLEKILKDEVENSKGAIAVACCGPTSLNVLTRKVVVSLIDPARIAKGDRRGQITLVSEDFSW